MTSTQEEIREYILDNILFGDGEKLDAETSFQEGGILDSTGFLELVTFVEEKYGIEISDSELVPENFDTLRKMSSFVDQKRRKKTPA
jgi:acyl carrier protein